VTEQVVQPGEFVFASAFMDHGHIYGQTNSLKDAGATLKWAYDPDQERLAQFLKKNPEAQAADSYDQILNDPEIRMVTSAAVPAERAEIGFQALQVGKDYFTDKCSWQKRINDTWSTTANACITKPACVPAS
jgi:predicted dehydrogenase